MKLEQNCGLVGSCLVRSCLSWCFTLVFLCFFLFSFILSLCRSLSLSLSLSFSLSGLSGLSVSVTRPLVRPSLSLTFWFVLVYFLFRSSLSFSFQFTSLFRSLSVSLFSFVYSLFHLSPPSALSSLFLSVLNSLFVEVKVQLN